MTLPASVSAPVEHKVEGKSGGMEAISADQLLCIMCEREFTGEEKDDFW